VCVCIYIFIYIYIFTSYCKQIWSIFLPFLLSNIPYITNIKSRQLFPYCHLSNKNFHYIARDIWKFVRYIKISTNLLHYFLRTPKRYSEEPVHRSLVYERHTLHGVSYSKATTVSTIINFVFLSANLTCGKLVLKNTLYIRHNKNVTLRNMQDYKFG